MQELQTVINNNHIMPILQNVLIEFKDSKITLTGDNLETRCSISKDVECFDEFKSCVNYSLLLSILKGVPDKKIELNFSDSELLVKHSKGSFKIPVFDTKEFPSIPKDQFNKKANVSSKSLRNSLKVANNFISNDDSDHMSNIYVDIGEEVNIFSTDRARLFKDQVKGSGDIGKILLNGRSTLALSNLIDVDENIKLHYNDTKVFIKLYDKDIFITQQNGKYAIDSFKNILNQSDNSELIKLNLSEFILSLKRVSILISKDKNNAVQLFIDKKNIKLVYENLELRNKSEEDLKCKFKGKKEIAFNCKFLIEILSVFNDPELMIHTKNNLLFIKENNKIGGLAPVII